MKTPIVILHGWGASSKSFNKVKELLAQSGHLIFVPDLPGFGQTEPPPKPWSIDDYVDWVLIFLKKQGIEQYVLFGHSFGGRIAIKIAAQQPKGLVELILCDAAGITPRPKIKISIFRFLSDTGKLIFSLPFLKRLRPLVRKAEYFLAGSKDYYYLQDEAMKETFKKVIEEDLSSYLQKINAKTLIVWGSQDKMTPVEDAYKMNDLIKESKLEVLKEVGHSPHLEQPEKLVNILQDFLKET